MRKFCRIGIKRNIFHLCGKSIHTLLPPLLLLLLLPTEDGEWSWQLMSASGRRSQLKLLILIIKECLRGGVGSECLFNGCLQSEKHQDGARLRACLLYLKNLFFLLSPSSLPPLGSTQTPHSSSQASAQYKHYTPCARNNNKKNSLETETNRQEKEKLANISSCSSRSSFFCRRCFSAARFVFVHGDRSFIASPSQTATPPVIFLSRKQSKYSVNKINHRQSSRFWQSAAAKISVCVTEPVATR